MDLKVFSSKENRLKSILVLIAIIIIIGVVSYFGYKYFYQLDNLKALILGVGWLGPFIIFLASVFQIVIPTIPGEIVNFLSGYFYGPLFGVIICLIGTIVGALIAFFLSKRFGRPFVEKVIKKEQLEKFDNTMKKSEAYYLLICLLLGLPDLLYFMAGLTTMRYRLFIPIVILGRIPGITLSAAIGYGSSLPQKYILLIILGVALVYVLLILIFKHNLKAYLEKQF
jgi:uncharacterized membrane protein YdjX (TVP38/TMEM64 family)